MKKLISVFLAFTMIFTTASLCPFSVSAYDIYDDDELTSLVEDIRQAMYNREPVFSVNYTVKDSSVNIDEIRDYICEAVYGDNELAYGGDYLRTLSDITSSWTKQGDSYKINFEFEYMTTAEQEEQVNYFLNLWNDFYIKDNERISSSSDEEKNFYTVKTIYNFLAKHVIYDDEVYDDDLNNDNEAYPKNKDRYKISHSAYGALVGNSSDLYIKDNLYNVDFDAEKAEEYLDFDDHYMNDSQQLYRVYEMNQGKSVCEGYTLVFYYLCKLNGIDCRIVKGAFEGNEDPHAWNEVMLNGKWYSVDATYGSQHTQKITNGYTLVDYSYFLRGSKNKSFSKEHHQQIYEEYDRTDVSTDDYHFALNEDDIKNAEAVVTRSREEDTKDDTLNIENYVFIDKDENGESFFKFTTTDGKNGYQKVSLNDAFVYYGANDGYLYSYKIYEYAQGVEYSCNDQKLKNAGDYSFKIIDPVTKKEITARNLTIAPLDMSDTNSYAENPQKFENPAFYTGDIIETAIEVIDSSLTKLVEGRDYIVYAYKKGDASKTPVELRNHGEYIIRVEYIGNYKGYIEFDFSIIKYKLSSLADKLIEVQYGIDLESNLGLTFESNGVEIKLVKDRDYKIEIKGGTNYLDEGEIIFTALNDSKFLVAGTQKTWKYKVNKRLNLTSTFEKNNVISGEIHSYTGNQIKPTSFTIYYTKTGGKRVNLVKDKDYVITGYGKNIDAGKGTVNVKFIGNYEGTAALCFTISKPTAFTVTISDLTYNGKTQTLSPKVTYNGKTLKKGTDYTVSGSGKDVGVYTLTVKGINNFSNITVKKTFIIKAGKITSLKMKSSTPSKIVLSWQSQGSNVAYQIYAYDTAKKKWSRIAQTKSNSCTVTAVYYNGKVKSLDDATNYQFKVRAVFSVNGEPQYGSYAQINPCTKPKTPTLKSVTKGKNAVKCTWSKNTRATGYQVVIATNSKFTKDKKTVAIKSYKTVSYTFNGLKKGKTYYVKVRTYKKVGSTTYYSSYSKVKKIKL